MKTLEYYNKLPYRLELVPDTEEGGYTAFFPELPGCITSSDTPEGALANALDAKNEWFKAAIAEGIKINEPSNDEYSGQFKLRIPKSLHRSLSMNAKKEGISMNQYCLYLLSKNDALFSKGE